MADNQRLGASWTIDITNLKAGLQQANRMIKESESEFKAAAAGMEDWTKSADGLTARNSHLTKSIDLQNKKIDGLQREYDRLISEGLDPTSKQATELRTSINKETEALKKNEKELKKNTKTLNELDDNTEDASKSMKELGDTSKETGEGFTTLKGAVAGFIANALSALVGKVGEAVSSLFGLADSTRELRNEMNRLETGFTQAGLSADDATNTYNALYGVLGDTGKASEAASHLALLANNSKDLSKWTDIATGVYATFGDSLPIEGLTEAANETAKTGDLTGVLADALNWAGVNEEDFQKKLDKASTEQERQAIITETLNDLYGETAEKFKETNKEVIAANEASNNLAQAQADLGAAMEPLNAKIDELKTNILTGLSPALNQIIEDLIEVFNGVEGSPERLANSISEFLTQITEKIIEYIPKFAEFAVQLVFMFAQTIVEQLPALVEAALAMVKTLLNTLGDMAPSLVATIVEAVILIAETLVNNVDSIIDAGIKLIQGLAAGLLEALPVLVSKIPTIISKLYEAIVRNHGKLLEAGIKLILELANGLIKAIPSLTLKIPFIIMTMVKALITEGVPNMINAGVELIEGLFTGLLNPKVIWESIKKLGNQILDDFKSFFGIHSPSKLMEEEIGTFMGMGIAQGIDDGFSKNIKGVQKAMVKSLEFYNPNNQGSINATNPNSIQTQGGIVVNQYNTYSKAHSRYELWKSKQQAAAAVRLAVGGKV